MQPVPERGVAIVTGGGGALGRATAMTLAARGFISVAVDRDDASLQDLPEGIRREPADLTDPAAVAAMVDRVASQAGAPAALVNTIGGFRAGDLADTTPEQLSAMMNLNVGVALWVSQAVAPHMRRRGSGAIVHVGARQGIEPSSGAMAYSASKAAVIHVTRLLDAELRPDGIRVNAVVPRLLDTPANRAAFPADVMARAVTPDALAAVIAFLVSDDAAPVSGAILPTYGLGG